MKLRGLSDEEVKSLVPQTPILVGYRGSIAHGMWISPSDENTSIDDKDIMGVCIPDLSYYFGCVDKSEGPQFSNRGVFEKFYGEWDCVSYEVRKFVNLLMNSNPNVMSLLWLDEQHYINIAPEGRVLIEARNLFVTKKIYHAFSGYAKGQLHRMTHFSFEGYMGQKRKTIVERFGYDIKNAAHLIRLLRQGIEFLREGKLYVNRSKMDGPELLEIKRGEWPLERVKEEADRLFKRAEAAYDACTWPNEPDPKAVNDVLMQILKPHFFCKWETRG